MSFKFKCPNCNYVITEADFNKNEQILSHLKENFKAHESNYLKELETKLIARYKIEEDKAIKSALITKENELLKSNQKELDKLNQVIANQKLDLEKKLSQQANQLHQVKNDEVFILKQEIDKLKNDHETQKLVLEKSLAAKENEILRAKQKQLDELNQIIADQKNQLKNSDLILKKTLAESENQLNQAKNNEIFNLKQEISKLKQEHEAQKIMLEKSLATKETNLLKSHHEQLNQLHQIIADQKNKLETNRLELANSLSQQELKFTQLKDSEALKLKNQIQELEKANLQFRVIQNKTKGENFEHEVEKELRKIFEPDDVISKITDQDKKADYLQEVRQDNTIIGKIVYEVKNAEWSNNWEKKLVDDMAKQGSKYGILIATSFNNKYAGIPFKRSDYNPNIYLTDSESFYFVGQILRTLIKIEYRLDSNRDKTNYSEKISQFNEWKELELPKLDTSLNDSLQKIDDLADSISRSAEKIKKEKAKVYKNWIKNIKDYLDNFIF
ncbi:hypothetical protein LT336_00515 [Spiroplasma sp. JKS002671]|uniref:DUF2130 domain-containing protein n=1 Tax=Spiroplasma attinicola TaxID=2904537 RepID=UPI002022B450|nr:DUF2130 domain-containing protein [Spiroplasma sp. JKS002671]MCL8210771.1 hypothetical protein [Spiroplasma sp. JKS002671]